MIQFLVDLFLHFTFEVSKHLIDLFKACKGIGVFFKNVHHFTNLSLIDNADQHILVCVRVHTMHTQLGNTMVQLIQKLLRQSVGIVGNDFKLVAVFKTT